MSTPPTLLKPGDTIAGFTVEDLIGIGGMATVYRARQASLGRSVALKVLARQFTGDEVFRERFRREGMHAASLEHPNIVPVYDSGEQDGLLYLAMRLVEGPSLAELLTTQGLTADRTIEILRPIAGALDCAHAAGLIHRDVKPQNILITNQGHPYLADFGVAKSADAPGLTATGGFVGSINYAAPEQIKGLTLTAASDVYALTAVLYHCLSGDVPYPSESEAGVMHAHLHEPPPTLPVLEGADSDFHTVFARGMAKDPGARYGHAGDLLNAAALCVSRMPSARRKSVPAFPASSASGDASKAAAAPAVAAAALTEADQRREPAAAAPDPQPPSSRLRSRLPRIRRPHAGGLVDRLPKPRAGGRIRRPSGRLVAAVGAGLLGVATVASLVVALGGGGSRPAAKTARGGAVELSYREPWRVVDAGAFGRRYGLRLRAPVALRAPGLALIAGRLANGAAVPGGLPAALSKNLAGHPMRGMLRLGRIEALTYEGRSAGGGATLTMYAVPTASGDIALLCRQDSGGAEGRGSCTAEARTLRVVGLKPVPPGADPALATGLLEALHGATRSLASSELAAASVARRARAAGRTAAAYLVAAHAVDRLPVEPRDRHAVSTLAASLRTQAGSLIDLKRAARARRYAAYADAAVSARKARRLLAAALATLRHMGFAGLKPPHTLAIAPLRRPRPKPQLVAAPPQGSSSAEPIVTEPEPEPAAAPAPEPAPAPSSSPSHAVVSAPK